MSGLIWNIYWYHGEMQIWFICHVCVFLNLYINFCLTSNGEMCGFPAFIFYYYYYIYWHVSGVTKVCGQRSPDLTLLPLGLPEAYMFTFSIYTTYIFTINCFHLRFFCHQKCHFIFKGVKMIHTLYTHQKFIPNRKKSIFFFFLQTSIYLLFFLLIIHNSLFLIFLFLLLKTLFLFFCRYSYRYFCIIFYRLS